MLTRSTANHGELTQRIAVLYYKYGLTDPVHLDISIAQGEDTQLKVNTEGADSVDEITVAGYTGLLIVREDVTILALADSDAGMFISMCSDCLGEAELLEIANTLTYSCMT